MITIDEIYEIFLRYGKVSTDSRNCEPSSIFFALRGTSFNANAYALSALEKGCAVAIVDDPQYATDDRFILVNDVLSTLQQLARHHRKMLAPTVIGITGTNGKTTTKELIAAVLSQKYHILYTHGNLNNHIGVPLTLLQLRPEHEIAIIEMGASKKGDIAELCDIARPDYGIITNVGKAHLEGFGSFEGVKATKGELYQYIAYAGKLVFINRDNHHLEQMLMASGVQIPEMLYDYSLESIDGQMMAHITSCSPFLELECKAQGNDAIEVKTKLIGSYNAENVLAAATIGSYFGLDAIEIKKGLESYEPQNNRSQLTITGTNKLVVDAYNANPTSMKAAIMNFAQMQVVNKALILGDMLELGEQSDEEHQAIADLLLENGFETVYLVGKEFSKTSNSFSCFDTTESLMDYLAKSPLENHYVLIKGSRGIKLEQVMNVL